MSVENPLWGAPRIHGELLKLGLEIASRASPSTWSNDGGHPARDGRTFLRNHAPDIAAMDLFVVQRSFSTCLCLLIVGSAAGPRLDQRHSKSDGRMGAVK